MKTLIRYACIAFSVVFLGIQLVPVPRANPSVISDVDAPLEVKEILRQSCYDCHSNETEWPWYSYVAPVSWLVAYDVKEGREELNFSNWDVHRGDSHMMEEIIEEIAEREMPMPTYLITHSKASIDAHEMELLKAWAGATGEGAHDEGHVHEAH